MSCDVLLVACRDETRKTLRHRTLPLILVERDRVIQSIICFLFFLLLNCLIKRLSRYRVERMNDWYYFLLVLVVACSDKTREALRTQTSNTPVDLIRTCQNDRVDQVLFDFVVEFLLYI